MRVRDNSLHDDWKKSLEWLASSDPAVQAQPDERGQRRRRHEAVGDGAGGRHRRHQREVGLRTLGAGLLRQVRLTTPEASAGRGHRGVTRR